MAKLSERAADIRSQVLARFPLYAYADDELEWSYDQSFDDLLAEKRDELREALENEKESASELMYKSGTWRCLRVLDVHIAAISLGLVVDDGAIEELNNAEEKVVVPEGFKQHDDYAIQFMLLFRITK